MESKTIYLVQLKDYVPGGKWVSVGGFDTLHRADSEVRYYKLRHSEETGGLGREPELRIIKGTFTPEE